MNSVQELYNRMFAGDVVRVRCAAVRDFNSLRTALCKKNSIPVALEMTTLSVCATYDSSTAVATFKLAESKRRTSEARWEIIEEESDDIRSNDSPE